MSSFEWKLYDLGAEKIFVGLQNYIQAFSDEVFVASFINTIVITVACLSIELCLGFCIALLLWLLKKSLRVVQSIILLPMIISPVVVALMWRYLYDTQFGMINWILRNLGVSSIAWLGDPNLSLLSVIIVDIWQMTSFSIIILYAAMNAIDDTWIEAAQVDGAKLWQVVVNIIIPSIKSMIGFTILMRMMDLLKIFDTIYVMTGGGPGYSSQSLAIFTYKVGFSQSKMGYAMALSMITLVCTMIVSYILTKGRKKDKAVNG